MTWPERASLTARPPCQIFSLLRIYGGSHGYFNKVTRVGSSKFQEQTLDISGVKTVVLTAGAGAPLVFWHGAGTFTGFDFALPWAEKFKVIIPIHPGFGRSGDDPTITSMHDYVLHYLELFDRLNLREINLVGFSMGGWMAATFASEHSDRLRKLVLVAPAGLSVSSYPTVDLRSLRPEDLPPLLAHDIQTVLRHLPKDFDPVFASAGQREVASFGRVINGAGPFDLKLPRWLHRINVPTFVMWGNQDRMIPVGQLPTWAALIPGAKTRTFEQAGHLVLDETPAAVQSVMDFFR